MRLHIAIMYNLYLIRIEPSIRIHRSHYLHEFLRKWFELISMAKPSGAIGVNAEQTSPKLATYRYIVLHNLQINE